MDPTREIVDAAKVGTLLAVTSGLGAVLGLGLLILGKRSTLARKVGLVGVCLAFIFPLWLGYNAIEDHLGLDSVAGLLINLALFAGFGIGVGLALRRLWPSTNEGRPEDVGVGSELAG